MPKPYRRPKSARPRRSAAAPAADPDTALLILFVKFEAAKRASSDAYDAHEDAELDHLPVADRRSRKATLKKAEAIEKSIFRRMLATPATTMAGVLVKLRVAGAYEELDNGGWQGRALESLLKDAERGAGRGVRS